MSKYSSEPSDPYFDAAHKVLHNRFGITDPHELSRVEVAISSARAFELTQRPIAGNFDLVHLQRIHRHLFGDVYAWAGEIRTVDITKGQTRFAHHAHIEQYAPYITSGLIRERFLVGLDPEQFSVRAADYMGELNVLHPFREGNGRALRAFMHHLADHAGYHIQWLHVDRQANLEASIQAYHGDSSGLARLIAQNLSKSDHGLQPDLGLTKQRDWGLDR